MSDGCESVCEHMALRVSQLRAAEKELQDEVRSLRTRAESAEEAFKAAEGEHAELWAERNGWQARAESVERERDEAYAKGQRDRDTEVAAMIHSFRDAHGEECRCETCVTIFEIVGELLALPIKERPQ